MVGLQFNVRSRRLPVFFLLDTSSEMDGTFQVTMQQGLLAVKHELSQADVPLHHIYLGGITFAEQATSHYLAPLEVFNPPTWEAYGSCNLKPALVGLAEALMFDTIAASNGRPGDYPPLVFLILGSTPIDTWEETIGTLASFIDNRQPLVVSLATRKDLAQMLGAISNYPLLLQSTEATYMTNFFFWVARTIAKVYMDYERGSMTVHFPDLPYGVVLAPR